MTTPVQPRELTGDAMRTIREKIEDLIGFAGLYGVKIHVRETFPKPPKSGRNPQ